MQGKNVKTTVNPKRKLAVSKKYISQNQLILEGFETPFEQKLTKNNRWVLLSKQIPWDEIVILYDRQFQSKEGRPPINGRIVLASVIIKHMLDLTDRETIQQISENMFMQYFLGYSSFTNETPFDPSLFVDIRERLSLDIMNKITELVLKHNIENFNTTEQVALKEADNGDNQKNEPSTPSTPEPKGTLLMDATVSPQNITYPTDLKVLNSSRIKSEKIIDLLYDKELHGQTKVRTYRNNARKDFLNTAKKKRKSQQEIIKANKKQLAYLQRNLGHIEVLLKAYESTDKLPPLKEKDSKYLETIKIVNTQQSQKYIQKIDKIENRIVNIHQPHVRPIVRGKEGVKTEFGSKLQVSLIDGFSFIDKLSWENFNEGCELKVSVENYKKKFGYYPERVLADQIYCTRENRKWLKEKEVTLVAKPLGRPAKEAVSIHISPGERNPIEGKFGQAKVGYGMNNILAKLKETSESWIASINLVLNLVRLMKVVPSWLEVKFLELIYMIFNRKNYIIDFRV
jgi:hypothetical protein